MEKKAVLPDPELSRQLLETFRGATGVSCFLLPADVAAPSRESSPACAFCQALKDLRPAAPSCLSFHRHSASQAGRFGGRYIYFCPHGLAHFASPVLLGGKNIAYLIGGPVLIMDPEDVLAGLSLEAPLSAQAETALCAALDRFPKREAAALNQLSALLFVLAAHLGSSTSAMLLSADAASAQHSIGNALLEFNEKPPAAFPSETEAALLRALALGSTGEAKKCLNELLGFILFHTAGQPDNIRSMSAELLFSLSAAAKDSGVPRAQLLQSNHRHFCQLERCNSFEEIASLLNAALRDYLSLVSESRPQQSRDAIAQALQFIRLHFTERLTLERVAAHVSLSPVYFSRLFKETVGSTFSSYLNALRIRSSAALLLETHLSVLDIASRCGFEDQSYFTKVFRKIIGSSPSTFRKRQTFIDADLERDRSAMEADHGLSK